MPAVQKIHISLDEHDQQVVDALKSMNGMIEELQQQRAGVRQLLIALRIQLKVDGREKWKWFIKGITKELGEIQ